MIYYVAECILFWIVIGFAVVIRFDNRVRSAGSKGPGSAITVVIGILIWPLFLFATEIEYKETEE